MVSDASAFLLLAVRRTNYQECCLNFPQFRSIAGQRLNSMFDTWFPQEIICSEWTLNLWLRIMVTDNDEILLRLFMIG